MADKQYLSLLRHVLQQGVDREDRTGTGTRSVFGYQMRFDLNEGVPILTTKRVHWPSIVGELLWFLSGSTNTNDLRKRGVTIWDEWGDPVTGELGPVYGAQWRSFGAYWRNGEGASNGGEDQIYNVIESLKNDPYSRRHIVTAWNPQDLWEQALPPCHCLFQFYVADGKLSCQLYQRSADIFLGVPFNIASYALLTHLIAREVGLGVGEFVHTLGDAHLYHNHFDQAHEQLTRWFRDLPTLGIDEKAYKERGLFNLETKDLFLVGYDPHPAIKAQVAV